MPVDAGVQFAFGAAPSPSFTDLESFGIRVGRAEWHIFNDGEHPIPIANADVHEFSWPHVLALVVNVSSPGVVITNRRLTLTYISSFLSVSYGVLPAYRQAIEAYMPDPVATNNPPAPKGAGAPASYQPLQALVDELYDDTPQEALAGVNGAFIELVIGTYRDNPSWTNITAYSVKISWDER